MKKEKLWKLSVVFAAFTMLTTTANASEVLSGDVLKNTGMGGANLNKVTGARVDSDLTNATITNTKKNSVLEWNSLNTGRDQSLNYIFPDSIGAGQTSLNKVIGPGMSQFAGKLTTEGSGHVIISNPNGMMLFNGSYVQANELTLTTKNVVLDELGNMTLKDNGNKNSIVIGKEHGTVGSAVIRVAKNLNIVAPIIDINGAEITSTGTDNSVLGGDIRLITADGVNFYVDTNKFTATRTNINNTNNITISNNANIAVKDKNSGKIYLTTKGNLNIKDSNLDNSEMYVGNEFNVNNAKVSNADITTLGNTNLGYGANIENSKIYAVKDIIASNANVTGSSLASERNIKVLNNSNIDSTKFYAKKGNADIINSTVKGNSVIKAGVLNLENSRLENSSVETSYIANIINNSVLTNSTIKAAHNVKIDNAKVINSDVQSTQKIYVGTNSEVNSSHLFANSEIFVNNSRITNNSNIATDKDLVISNSNLEGNGNLHLYSGNVTRLTNSNASGINFTGSSVALYASRLLNSTLDLKNTFTITNNSEVFNLNGVNKGELNINGSSRVYNSTLASGAGLSLTDATITGSTLMSEGNATAKNSTIDNSTFASTKNDVYFEDSTSMNNAKLLAEKVLDINHSNLYISSASADKVKAKSSKLSGTSVKADSDVTLTYTTLENNANVLSNGTLEMNASTVNNSNISSVGDMNIAGTNTITNGKLFTNGKIFAEGLTSENSSVGAEDTALIKKSKFNNSNVYAKNYLTLKSNIINNSYISSKDVEIGNSEVRNTRFSAKRHLSFYDYSIVDNIMADYFQSISVTTNSKISNSNLRVGYLLLDDVDAENVNAEAKYDLKYYNTDLLGNMVTATAKQNIIMNNVSNSTSISMNGGNIYINNSELGDAILSATLDGINVVSSEAKSLSVSGQGDVVIYDSNINNNLSIRDNDNVSLIGNYVGENTTVDNVSNVIVQSSNSETSSTLFDELTENMNPVTSYDNWKYTDEDFSSKMTDGNKNSVYMGSFTVNNADSVGIADTVLIGDVNFNNLSGDVEVINSYVGGNLVDNNVLGDYSWYKVYTNARQKGNNGNNGNHYGWNNGSQGNNGNHYGWGNGNHYGWDNGKHHGWGHKDKDYGSEHGGDNIGWDWDNRYDYGRNPWDWGWDLGRPHDRFNEANNHFNGNFLAYWHNFMYNMMFR